MNNVKGLKIKGDKVSTWQLYIVGKAYRIFFPISISIL